MNKYVWIGCLAVLMLTGCGESKEEAQARKEREFWAYTYEDDSKDRAKREKLYDDCYDKNVRSLKDIRNEARRISGNDNAGSKEFQEVFLPMDRERSAALAKCNKIRAGN